jgi:hypothetical protein
MRTRRTARGLGVLALLVPLSGAGLLLSAAPAQAASGITSPGNGVDYANDTTVHIGATVDKNTGSAELRLKSPASGTAELVDSASTSLTAGASLSYDFDTATCASFPAACSGRAEAANGVWTVTLISGGKAVDTSSFTVRIAPRAPRNVSARADGYRAVVLTWIKGDEPDLTGWTLDADGATQSVSTAACSGGTSCSTTLTYSQDGTGQHTYALVAHRRVAPDSAETLDSPRSADASATLDSPPPPPPPSPSADAGASTTGGTPDGSGSGSPSSTGGSAGTGGSSSSSTGGPSGSGPSGSTGSSTAIGTGKAPATLAQRRAFALTFKAFAPKLGIPKLPPLPSAQGPSVAPLPDGTYEKTLGYKDVVTTEKVSTPAAAARRVTGVVSSALDSAQFARFMAAALVLLLLAAHARRWLGSHHDE